MIISKDPQMYLIRKGVLKQIPNSPRYATGVNHAHFRPVVTTGFECSIDSPATRVLTEVNQGCQICSTIITSSSSSA